MIKKSFKSINLNCSFQSENPICTDASSSSDSTPSTLNPQPSTVISGLFSRNQDGTFSFEEVIPKTRDVRNAKIFDGNHLSLVRMKNGKIQIHMKTIDTVGDVRQLAFDIYSEVSAALSSICRDEG